MRAQLLDVGDTAFGMLVDMSDLPETAAMLRRDADGLQLVVPLPRGDGEPNEWAAAEDDLASWIVSTANTVIGFVVLADQHHPQRRSLPPMLHCWRRRPDGRWFIRQPALYCVALGALRGTVEAWEGSG